LEAKITKSAEQKLKKPQFRRTWILTLGKKNKSENQSTAKRPLRKKSGRVQIPKHPQRTHVCPAMFILRAAGRASLQVCIMPSGAVLRESVPEDTLACA